MRIAKKIPAFFSIYLKKKKPIIWDDLDGETRKQLRNHIKTTEQFNVDAYTQQKLITEHIDHYKKRSLYPQLCFDYNNLFVANGNTLYGASYKDKKIKVEDYDVIYNPALHMDKFEFDFDGSISPKDENDNKALKTIEIFNLDNTVLEKKRRAIFRNAKDMSKQIEKSEIITYLKYQFHSGVKLLLE